MSDKSKFKKTPSKSWLISGVYVNPDAEDLQSAKSLQDISDLEIFSHLSESERIKAEGQLADKLGIKKTEENPIKPS